MNFKCPKCKNGVWIEEIRADVVVSSIIDEVSDDGYSDYLESKEIEGGYVVRYQCESCGQMIKDKNGWLIDSPEELYEHALEQGWIEEEEE